MDALADEWEGGLRGLDAKQISRGIDQCRLHNVWPPTIAEFRAACAEPPNAAMYRSNDEALIKLPAKTMEASRAIGFEHLERMKAQLSASQETR